MRVKPAFFLLLLSLTAAAAAQNAENHSGDFRSATVNRLIPRNYRLVGRGSTRQSPGPVVTERGLANSAYA